MRHPNDIWWHHDDSSRQILSQDVGGLSADRYGGGSAEPIKGPGVYDIPVKLGHEVSATVKLWVAEEPA